MHDHERKLREFAEPDNDSPTARWAVEEIEKLRELEKQYCERLGELARLADVVCSWVLENHEDAAVGSEVLNAAEEIMEYVDAVRP